MNLLHGIINLFQTKKATESLSDPGEFFSREKASELIQNLSCSQQHSKGLTSIEALSVKIAKASLAEYTIIARLDSHQRFKAITITETDKILKHNSDCFETKILSSLLSSGFVQEQNTNDILSHIGINTHNIQLITSILLNDNENNPIGAVFSFSKSASNKHIITNVLKFFSFNITSEMQHLINKEKLENKNKELLRTEEELKLKNQLLNNLNKNISKAKQVVDESSRLKSAFLANLSHEIRTPMNVIMGFTELLSADNMSSDQRRNYIDIIQQNGTRLLHIMDSLIDISRFQAKNIGKEQQAFSLNQMMQQLLNNYQSEINITGKPIKLKLTLSLGEGEDIVTLDKEATYKVLNHLLDNAIKFTASGFVNFGYETPDKQILFYVEDSGIGIPEGKENEIFDLFRQGDLRLSRQFGGTGLGLAIAKRYVNAMNGKIWCNNKKDPKSRGSVFKFTLPILPNKDSNNEFRGVRDSKHLYISTTRSTQ